MLVLVSLTSPSPFPEYLFFCPDRWQWTEIMMSILMLATCKTISWSLVVLCSGHLVVCLMLDLVVPRLCAFGQTHLVPSICPSRLAHSRTTFVYFLMPIPVSLNTLCKPAVLPQGRRHGASCYSSLQKIWSLFLLPVVIPDSWSIAFLKIQTH